MVVLRSRRTCPCYCGYNGHTCGQFPAFSLLSLSVPPLHLFFPAADRCSSSSPPPHLSSPSGPLSPCTCDMVRLSPTIASRTPARWVPGFLASIGKSGPLLMSWLADDAGHGDTRRMPRQVPRRSNVSRIKQKGEWLAEAGCLCLCLAPVLFIPSQATD